MLCILYEQHQCNLSNPPMLCLFILQMTHFVTLQVLSVLYLRKSAVKFQSELAFNLSILFQIVLA